MIVQRGFTRNSALILTSLLFACGKSTGPAMSDSGVLADAETDAAVDAGPVYRVGTTCANPDVVEGVLGSSQSVRFDTTHDPNGQRDLGLACGNVDAMRWAPQWVIAYHVPGTGPVGVTFSTQNAGTAATFDTVLQIRDTDCTAAPTTSFPFTCFDSVGPDSSPSDLRATGVTTAMGGSTIYVIVTGYSNSGQQRYNLATQDRGPMEVAIQAAANAPPTLASATGYKLSDRMDVDVTGMDSDANAYGAAVLFKDSSGNTIDVNGDGRGNEGDRVVALFDSAAAATMASFTTGASFPYSTYTALKTANPMTANVVLFDHSLAVSASVTANFVAATGVGWNVACDGTHRCDLPLSCTSGTCAAPAALATACTAATVVALPTIADNNAVTVNTPGTISMGAASNFSTTTCGVDSQGTNQNGGPEALMNVTVPTGTFDLIVGTDNAQTSIMDDTIMYVRSSCPDPSTELASGCNDDVNTAGHDYRSHLEFDNIAPGTYTVFVEAYGGPTAATFNFSLATTLRPVLATGTACDSTGALNRCATGVCPSGSMPVCP